MKIKKYLIIILLMMLYFIPNSALATGNISVSTTKINVIQGKTSSFKISANNAAGRVDITSLNTSIATVSSSSIFLDMNSETITITGKALGTTTIKVYVEDGTTYDDEDITGKTYNIQVTVSKPANTSTNTNTPNQNNKPSTGTNTSNSSNDLSTNNNLKSLTVDGYTLKKIDNNNYELDVQKDVTNVNIKAEAEDSKAKISGIGLQKLQIGENNIEVIVTSESGSENKILIKINRKENYYLSDLETLLKNNQQKEVSINIDSDDKITKENFNNIKSSKKKVNFNYYNENKELKYSWMLDGKEINNIKEITTSILFDSNNKGKISELSNYAEGLYINLLHNGEIPNGVKVKLYVGNKFENGNIVNIYRYDAKKNALTFIDNNVKVNEGYIEYKFEHGMEHFITMSKIGIISSKQSEIGTIETTIKMSVLLIIFSLIVYFFIISIKKSKSN